MHISYRPPQSISCIVKMLKGKSSRKLQQEYPELRMKYWGQQFWAIGYGSWNTGNITDEMVNGYIEQHRRPDEEGASNFIIE